MDKTITITLTPEEAKEFVDYFKGRAPIITPLGMKATFAQIRAQLALSDRELFLKVMRGEWVDTSESKVYRMIHKKTGEISLYMRPLRRADVDAWKDEYYFAPSEFAQQLASVIKGEYRPDGKDLGTKFWCIGRQRNYDLIWADDNIATIDSIYFFTESQRNAFAGFQKKEPFKFKYDTVEQGYGKKVDEVLNSMLTFLRGKGFKG